MKKTKKLSKTKYPALQRKSNPKSRRDLIDMDYLDQLSEKELIWFNKFMNEYNGAKLDYKNLKKNLHRTKKLKKDCTDKNNARNRCLYNKGIKFYINHYNAEDERVSDNLEDALIEYIDQKPKKSKKKSG